MVMLHVGAANPDLPDAGEGLCCIGSAMRGPGHCTCWEPVYDLDQAEPVMGAGATVRAHPCEDCAYRPDSPEKANAGHVLGDADFLDAIVVTGEPFWCHQGIRRPVRLEHRPEECDPTGVSIPGSEVNYSPPIIDAVPFKADGSPADICAGWAARAVAWRSREAQ